MGAKEIRLVFDFKWFCKKDIKMTLWIWWQFKATF